MNRKGGGEELMFFPFIIIAGILFGGVGIAVSSFYGQGYDFREAEAQQLSELTKECFLKNDFFSLGFDIKDDCMLNKEVVENEHLIYISGQGQEFSLGVIDYRNQCTLEGARENKNYPKCVNGTWTKNGVEYNYVIGSNQQGRRILSP